MTTGLIYSDRFLDHDTRSGHPERADRLRAIMTKLRETGLLDRLVRIDPTPIDRRWLLRCHAEAYIDRAEQVCRDGQRILDCGDVKICEASYDVALLAAGGVLKAAEAIMAGQVDNAFCAVRPPGHHAERDEAMGFCLFANVAIAADYLTQKHGLERVAVVDFDVHHGNGTQHIHERRDDILFISLHEDPQYLYPNMGFLDETGIGEGKGFTLNLPIVPPAGDDEYLKLFDSQVLPKLQAFAPQFLLVSAGFDAAEADPLAHMNVSTEGFRRMTQLLKQFADEHCDGRLLSSLEGGYDLEALSDGVAAHVDVLLG